MMNGGGSSAGHEHRNGHNGHNSGENTDNGFGAIRADYEESLIIDVREEDREITWAKHHMHYVRRTLLTERIPVDDVATCLWCGDPMFDAPLHQKYCRSAHRVAHYRRRQELQEQDMRG